MADEMAKTIPESNQEGAMPAPEQQAEPTVTEEVVPVKEEAETVLPVDTSDRTSKQFDKLLESNRQLVDQVRKMQPRPEPKPATPIYDSNTDMVNVTELERMRQETAKSTKELESLRAEVRQGREQAEERSALEAVPELATDNELRQLTRGLFVASLSEGKEITMKQAAVKAQKYMGKKVADAKVEAKKEALEEITPKEQASLAVAGSSSAGKQQASVEQLESLAERTRHGDAGAIMERLRGIPSA